MTFQFNSKSVFLTYPQCDYSLESFATNIEKLFGSNIDKCIAAQELHQDGNTHLHAAICLKAPFRSRDARCFDLLAHSHPNINSRFKGGWKKAFKYVMKEGNFLTLPKDLDLETLLVEKDPKTERVARMIKFGTSLDEVDNQEPGYMLVHLQAVQRYHSFIELKKRRNEFAMAQLQKVLVQPAEHYSSDWNQEIASWLTSNIRQKRSHRQAQMWIKAPPGAGKTSLLMWMEKIFNLSIYYWPRDEKWWDGYSDGCYDLIVLDEYRAQKMITELNPILSGDPTPLSRRNAPPLVKRDNLPVIILSNFSPMEAYHKVQMSQLHPLLDRLQFIEVPEGGLIRIEDATPVAPDEEIVNFDDNPNVFEQALDDPPDLLPSSFAPAGISALDHSYHLAGKSVPPAEDALSEDDFITECSECHEPYEECGSCDGCCGCVCHIGTRQDPLNFKRADWRFRRDCQDYIVILD